MRTTTSNYDTENAKLVKKPVWALKFENIDLQSNFNLCTGNFDITNTHLNNHVSDFKYHKERDIIDTSDTGEYDAAVSDGNFNPQVYTYRGEYNRTYFTWIKAANMDHMVNYYDHDDNEMSTPVSAGYYTAGATDPHCHSSVIVADDGHIIIVYEQLTGAGASAHNSPWVVKRSVSPETTADGFDTADGSLGDYNAYPKLFKLSDGTLFILGRYGPNSSDHYRVGYYKSTDDGKTWGSLVTVATMTDAVNYWAYNMRLASSDGDGLHICINAQDRDSPTGFGYPVCYYLWSSDGVTWYDIDSSFSKDVVSSGAITLAELDANCIIDDERGVDRDLVRYIACGVVSDAGNPYLIMVEGTRSGGTQLDTWCFYYYDSGWTRVEIPNVVTGYYTDFYEEWIWGIVSYSEDKFDIYLTSTVGAIREMLRWQTTDKGVTWTQVEEISEDSDYDYKYMAITANHPDWEYVCYQSGYLNDATLAGVDIGWGVNLRVTTFFPYLQNLKYNSPRINVKLSLTDFGDLDFDVLDKDNTFTQIIQQEKKFCNDKVTLYHGYDALDFDDFSEFPSYYIDGISLADDMLVYSIKTRTLLSELFSGRKFFSIIPSTPSTVDLTASGTTLTVDDLSDFYAVDSLEETGVYVVIDDKEICQYEATDETGGVGLHTFTLWDGGLGGSRYHAYSRSYTSDDFIHAAGANVKQCFRIVPYRFYEYDTATPKCTGKYVNPFTMINWLLTTTATGTNGAYDLGIDGFGAGIDSDYIDLYGIQHLGLKIWYYLYYSYSNCFYFNTVTDPLKFIETYFLNPTRCFMYINKDSKISIKMLDAIDNTTVGSISDDTIISIGNINIRYDLMINQMTVNTINPLSNEIKATTNYECDESLDKVGTSNIYAIDSRFTSVINTNPGSPPIVARRIFGTFSNPPVEMTVDILDSKNQFMAGDIISISSDRLPDWINQGRGVSSLSALVLEQIFTKFSCRYKLLLFDVIGNTTNYTIEKYDELDDEDLSLDADTTTAWGSINAEDAYHDVDPAETCNLVRFKIVIDALNESTSSHCWGDFQFCLYESNPHSLLTTAHDIRIHFDPSCTEEQVIWHDYYLSESETITGVRVDYYAHNGATDYLSTKVHLREVWFITENYTTTAV